MPNTHAHHSNDRGIAAIAMALANWMRTDRLPRHFKRLWGEDVDPDSIDIAFIVGDSRDVNLPHIKFLLVPQAQATRFALCYEMIEALREDAIHYLSHRWDGTPLKIEVEIAFAFGGGAPGSGPGWSSEIPLLVDRGELQTELTSCMELLRATPSSDAEHCDHLADALTQLIGVMARAGGLNPSDLQM
jgi:hypothetical protein